MSTAQSSTLLTAKLVGIRPIMFDRYAGDNSIKLQPLDKLNTDNSGNVVFPVLNLYSMLTAQNTDSVANRFGTKENRKKWALGINAFCEIAAHGFIDSDDIVDIPIMDADGKAYHQSDSRIKILFHVARMKKGAAAIPNPKERPVIPTGWNMTVDFRLLKNDNIHEAGLRQWVECGGILGLGTFRPMFGRYRVEWL